MCGEVSTIRPTDPTPRSAARDRSLAAVCAGDAVQSDDIGDNEETWTEMTVEGVGKGTNGGIDGRDMAVE